MNEWRFRELVQFLEFNGRSKDEKYLALLNRADQFWHLEQIANVLQADRVASTRISWTKFEYLVLVLAGECNSQIAVWTRVCTSTVATALSKEVYAPLKPIITDRLKSKGINFPVREDELVKITRDNFLNLMIQANFSCLE
jgi:hypothetical protein